MGGERTMSPFSTRFRLHFGGKSAMGSEARKWNKQTASKVSVYKGAVCRSHTHVVRWTYEERGPTAEVIHGVVRDCGQNLDILTPIQARMIHRHACSRRCLYQREHRPLGDLTCHPDEKA